MDNEHAPRVGSRRIGITIGIVAFVLWTLAPVIWMLISSLIPQQALIGDIGRLSWHDLTLANYRPVLESSDLVKSLTNSVVVAAFTTAAAVVIGAPAAYALARLQLRHAEPISLLILACQMFPPIVVAIPLFILASDLGLIDSRFTLIVVYLSFNLPVVIWILRGFFLSLPAGLERAATIDGASTLQLLRRVIAPLSKGPLVAAALFCFISSWNEFFFAFLLTERNATTLPVLISSFSGQYQTDVGQLMAALVLAVLPITLLAVIFNKALLKGLIEGATKG